MAPQVPTIRRNSSRSNLPAAKSANALHSPHMGYDTWNSMPSSQPLKPQQASPCTSRSNSYVNGFSRSASFPNGRCVHFQVEAETSFGDSLVLVGSTEQLGCWNPKKGLALTTDAETYPIWHLAGTDMGVACDIEFKVVKLHGDGEAEWETFGGDSACENRRLVLARDAPAAVRLSLKWGERRTLVHASTQRHQNRRPSPLSTGHGSTPSVGATPPTVKALAQQPPIIRPSSGCSIASSIDVGEPVFSLTPTAIANHAAAAVSPRNALLVQKSAAPTSEAAAAAAAVAAPFTVAPRPSNSYSVPQAAEAHAAAENVRREQMLRSLLQRPSIPAPPTSAAAAALVDATAAAAAALPPSVAQAPPAAPRLAASAPMARPPAASTTQPLHRPGAPLDAIASMDLSWPPSPCSSPRSSHGYMPSAP